MMQTLPAWPDQVLLLGVATARIAAAFMLVPLFAPETIPTMVRNSILVALGLVSLSLQPALPVAGFGAMQWATMFAKELFVGLIIGFFFGTVLWALEAAGQIIDTKIGATMAQVVDPLSGHQTSLNGAFFGRLANVVFLFSGGLGLLVGVIMESYVVWPIAETLPQRDPRGLVLFEQEFGRLMVLATLFAAPVLVVLFVIDASLGLVNRFAQQLNVFALSMSIKSFAATAIILLLVASFAEAVTRDVLNRPQVLQALLGMLAP